MARLGGPDRQAERVQCRTPGARPHACSPTTVRRAMCRRRLRNKITETACLSCHDAPMHQAKQTFTPACTTCHVDIKELSTGRDQRSVLHAVPRQSENNGREAQFAATSRLQQRTSGVRRRAAGARARSRDHQAQPPGAHEERSERSQRSGAVAVRAIATARRNRVRPELRATLRELPSAGVR